MATPLTRAQMAAIIDGGLPIVFNGTVYYTSASLPSQETIDAIYAYGAQIEGPQGPAGPTGPAGPAGSGSGNVNGPVSATDGDIALFDGPTGTLIKDSGATLASKQDALGFTAVPNTRTVAGHALSADVTVSKSDVGLGNVDNTSNATERAASATLTNKTLTSPAITTPTGIVKGDVGLGNVDNTSNATERAAAATLTNKTIVGANNTISGITEAMQTTADNTTADVSTSKHGYAPKAPNDTAKFLRGDGTWAAPAGGGSPRIFSYENDGSEGAVANTTSLSSLLTGTMGTFGSLVLAANKLVAGSVVRVRAAGTIAKTGSPEFDMSLRAGSTSIAYAQAWVPSAANSTWVWEVDLVVENTTTCRYSTKLISMGADGALDKVYIADSNSGAIDTTASITLDIKGSWSAASSSNSVCMRTCTIEVL